MRISKWVMKQYWRAGTVRAIFGLLMGMLVLGRYYYGFIPELSVLGILGAIILSLVFLLLFMGAGYLYDAKGRLWNEQFQVIAERDPYSYVPPIKSLTAEFPLVFALVDSLRQIARKLKIDTTSIDDIIKYLEFYFALRPDRIGDIKQAQINSRDYLNSHPFDQRKESMPLKIGYRPRFAKAFQLQVWRLTWVQNFTGLAQDVLVFAALYTPVLFSEVANENIVPLDYLFIGLLLLSLPLYLGLVAAGWYYDKMLRMWSPDMVVKAERNPFSYVADPHMEGYVQPFLFALLDTYVRVHRHLGIEAVELEKIISYFDSFWKLSVKRDEDMKKAIKMREELAAPYIFQPTNEGV